jgi:alkylation response protein AidB-like acyl-CoA dehydrogenase
VQDRADGPQVEKFVEEECIPADAVYVRQIGETTAQRFSSHPAVIEDLKKRARELGLWNMFLPKAHFKEGAGFSNLEYGIMAEYLGKSRTASEVCLAMIVGLEWLLTGDRLPTVLLLTRATWRCWPSTAARHRRGSGLTRC